MSLRGNSITIPFSSGLLQKGDKRLQNPPALDKCVDAEFDDVGGLRTRKPYAALGVSILGGGTLSNIRKIVPNGDELLCFTDTGLYSWDASGSAWVSKATHLACAVDETPVVVDTSDQYDADMAVSGNLVFYTWYSALNGGVYLSVVDSTTRAVVVSPFLFTGIATLPRLTAVSNKILLTYVIAGAVSCWAIDPATPTQTAIVSSPAVNLASGHTATGYDIKLCPDGATAIFAAKLNPTTSYLVGTVTSALTVTSSVKARTCDGVIACAVSPDSAKAQVVRTASSATKGDLLTYPALADSTVDQALWASVGTSLAIGYKSTTVSGFYRCYMFFDNKIAWANTDGSIAAAGTLNFVLNVASQPFDRNGTVYVWAVFNKANRVSLSAAQPSGLQNAYYLIDTSGTLHAKAAYDIASGNDSRPNSVVSLGGGHYAWCTSINRLIAVATDSRGYAQRTPRRIDVTFDDNRARRCLRLGRTLYIAGGEIRQYDGVGLYEVGFHVAPWDFLGAFAGSGGSVDAGTHAFKATLRWENAQGEIERSTTTCVGTGTAAANDKLQFLVIYTSTATHKGGAPAVEVWRTLTNPTADSPFYLVTSKDPANATNPNRYLFNDQSGSSAALDDTLSDASLSTKENNPENGSVLENLAPPPATVIAADQQRVYLAGIAGAPNVVWYSKQRAEGEVAAFNDALAVQLPATGGDITALAFLNETLIVFKETAIYALPGDGYDNTGGGNNFGPPRLISSEVGAVSAESVALTDIGLVFKSDKGWYELDRGWQCQYVGGPVTDYDGESGLAVDVIPVQHQVRIPTSARMLVWDTLVNQWGEWTVSGAVSSCIWNGVHVYATSSAIYQQRSDFTGVNYGMDVETAWVKPAEAVGQCRVQWLMPLGEYRSACSLRIRIGRNYRQDGAGEWEYFDDKFRSPATVAGGPLQVRIGPSIPWMEAIKVRLTAVNVAEDGTAPTGEALKLSAVGLEFGIQPGLFKRLAAAQKQ
jgi:hypothetical protein